MRDQWFEELLDERDGEDMRAGFDARLRGELSAMWADDGSDGSDFRDGYIPIEPIFPRRRRSTPPSRRGLVSAAAIVLVVALGAVVVGTRNGPSDEDPIGGTSPDVSSSVLPSDSTTGPSADTTPAVTAPELRRLIGTTWVVSEIDGRPYTGPTSWFRLEGDTTMIGDDGCNAYGAGWKLGTAVGTLSLSDVEAEGKGCGEYGIQLAGGAVRIESDALHARGRAPNGRNVDIRAIATDRMSSSSDRLVGSWYAPSGDLFEFTSDGRLVVGDCTVGNWYVGDTLIVMWPAVDCAHSIEPLAGPAGIATDHSLIVLGGERGEDIVRLTRALDESPRRIDLEIPRQVVTPLDVEPYMTVPSDARTYGEPLIALFPDSILVVREIVFEERAPATIVGYRYDRETGEKTGEFAVGADVEGGLPRPVRIFGSAKDVLYVQLFACSFLAFGEATDGEYDLLARVDDVCPDDRALIRVVRDGLEVDGRVVLDSPRTTDSSPGASFPRWPVAVRGPDTGSIGVAIERVDSAGPLHSWTLSVQSDGAGGAGVFFTHVAPYQGGVAVGMLNGKTTPVLATLDGHGSDEVVDLGDWTIAGIDQAGAVFWRVTANDTGIELARLRN
ncbi:MAG: META domain-containing protein [Actinomycetota bacterium]|nr:META domain-containing protein [Actinomycetota bacterium]